MQKMKRHWINGRHPFCGNRQASYFARDITGITCRICRRFVMIIMNGAGVSVSIYRNKEKYKLCPECGGELEHKEDCRLSRRENAINAVFFRKKYERIKSEKMFVDFCKPQYTHRTISGKKF